MTAKITQQCISIIERAAQAQMTPAQIIEEEIKEFKNSEAYRLMLEGEKYYRNRSDVQSKSIDLPKRSNVKIEEPIIKKLIDQKEAYLLSRQFTLSADSDVYAAALNALFDNQFRRILKSVVKSVLKSGIAYLQPYFDEKGMLRFLRLPSHEVIPLWLDNDHTQLEAFIRFYDVVTFQGREKKKRMAVEYWDQDGVRFFIENDGGQLVEDSTKDAGTHLAVDGQPYNWENVPLVWVKYNEEEMPLHYFLKELIDDMNWQGSITADVLRDVAKFIYVLKGYDGQNMAEFLSDLQRYMAIKLQTDGGIDKLQAELNIDAVMKVLEKYRRDIYDYAAGVDTKDPELGNASGNAINFRYMDLENDCQNLANELRTALERLKPFMDTYFQLSGQGDFSRQSFEIVFNTDMPVEESGIINNVKASWGIISKRTARAAHPWVTDVEQEEKQIELERKEEQDIYGEGLFGDLLKIGGEGNGQQPRVLDGQSTTTRGAST